MVQVFGQGDSETASDNVGPYHMVMNYEWSYEIYAAPVNILING